VSLLKLKHALLFCFIKVRLLFRNIENGYAEAEHVAIAGTNISNLFVFLILLGTYLLCIVATKKDMAFAIDY
jgi:hypothetical protein